MTPFPKCRFIETVQKMPTADITPDELEVQYSEFLHLAQDYLCTLTYFEVYDTFDTLT